MRAFEDHFSRHAEAYARYRPTYPPELYSFLASLAPDHRLAWDCGTGNGQAALGLVEYFDRVIATDASTEQLSNAPPHDRIEYRVVRAEESGLPSRSVSLTTVAVAVHWFDFGRFYSEVRRVAVPNGVIAVWCYNLPSVEPAFDRIVERYFAETLAGYWPERFRHVREQYRSLPFPFEELAAPEFGMETSWDLNELVGFLYSWSGTVNYEKQHGLNPVETIKPELARAWGKKDKRLLRWRIFLKVAHISGR